VKRKVFDLDNPKDVAVLIQMDRSATEFEKAMRAVVDVINRTDRSVLRKLSRINAEWRQPVEAWENEGGSL
jgi:hypothetical protein